MTQNLTSTAGSLALRLGNETGRHWAFLDLVRLTGAVLVLLGHVRGLLLVSMAQVEHPNPLIRAFYLVSGLQHEGLVMFFIVSGFLVGGSVWRLIAQARFDLGAYLINRFARIYLVFIPALLLVLVLNTLGSQFLADGRFYGVRPLLPAMIFAEWWWPQIPCHLAALQGLLCLPWGANPPFWTLGYEWGLYLIAPAIFGALLVPMLPRRRLLSCAAVSIVFVALTWWNPDWPTWFAFWMLGAIASRVFRTGRVGLPAGLAGLCDLRGCAGGVARGARSAVRHRLVRRRRARARGRQCRRSCDGRRACARSRAAPAFPIRSTPSTCRSASSSGR